PRQALSRTGAQAADERPPVTLHEGAYDGEHLLIRLGLRQDDLRNALARLAPVVRAGVPTQISIVPSIPAAGRFQIHALSPGPSRGDAVPMPSREAWCMT